MTPLTAANRINNQQTTRSGGAGGLRIRVDSMTREEDMHTTIKQQTDHAEGGLVGDDDDGNDDNDDNDSDDGHDEDVDNDDDGGCGGRDGHHQMRKGRGTEQTQQSKSSQKWGGETVVMAVTMMTTTTTTTTMKPRIDRGCSGGEWQAAAMAVAVAMRGCFGNIIRHPQYIPT